MFENMKGNLLVENENINVFIYWYFLFLNLTILFNKKENGCVLALRIDGNEDFEEEKKKLFFVLPVVQ